MELDYCGELLVDAPSLEQVFEYLAGLADSDDGFLILARADENYVQACPGYYVEFRDGSEEKHFCSARDDLTLDEARSVFEKYYNDDTGYQTAVEFQPWK